MRSHTQSVVTEPNRRRITESIAYKPLISDISVLIIVCNKTGGTIKGDKKISKQQEAMCYRRECIEQRIIFFNSRFFDRAHLHQFCYLKINTEL